MNKGTEISELLRKQDFNWHNYGRCQLYSTTTGLRALVNSHTSDATWFIIDETDNNTFKITKGIGRNPEVVDQDIPADELSTRLHNAIMNK